MSYQVLARKYRPKSFDTLVGQEHIVRALTHSLDNSRLHHAYLFTGTRGVGKTTLSRILAKSFNCRGADGNGGITASPCGVCEACTAIDAGRFVDYIEMDAASNRGVDEMAQLLEQAIYSPSNARFKIYMIDEVHMLTNHAFNSMLKTLEEPPEHVKFILATTDPQKIPVTVLSRCLQFNLKQMLPGHIVSHLKNILDQEIIEFETPALRLLAQGAHGSMRDALSLTDQAIAYAAGKVTLEAVQGMLGVLDQSFLVRILDALSAKDGAGLLALADQMATCSLSYNAALQDLGSLLHHVALAQSVPAAVPENLPEREDITRLASLFDAEEIQLFYQIAVHGRNELDLAPDEYAGFSMTLLRMLAFRPGFSPGERPSRPSANSAPVSVAPVHPSASPAPAVQVAPPAAAHLSDTPQVSTTCTPVPRKGLSLAKAALEVARAGLKGASPTPAVAAQVNLLAAPASASASLHAFFDEAPPMDLPDLPWSPPQYVGVDVAPEYGGRDQAFHTLYMQEKTNAAPVPIMTLPPVQKAAPAYPPRPFRMFPLEGLAWDGNWPMLAATLPLRGVAQQLAHQSELMAVGREGNALKFELQVQVETLLAAGSVEKLTTALSEHFGYPVYVEPRLGPVQHTASAAVMADRAERQREAEKSIQNDPFVQKLMREFGATIVPGSVRPV